MFLQNFHPIIQTLIGTGFACVMTALGAASIFFFRRISKKFLDGMLGFAAGVMMAASFWSLLQPAIEMSQGGYLPKWFPPLVGFLLGGAVLRIIDRILPHLHINMPITGSEGVKTSWRRGTLMFLAMTLHNIPEGLAVGVAFGAVAAGIHSATLAGAFALSIAIGIQDIPEGAAVAFPLRGSGLSKIKSFLYGALSGVVEPIAAVIGVVTVISSRFILPYALSFAAGAMIFVVVEEVIPEAQNSEHSDIATMGTIIGFALMMVLEVSFG